MQKLLGTMRRAITDFNMIEEGDHIAVGVSGGKDSLALAAALSAYRRFSPQKFTLSAVRIDMGFADTDQSQALKLQNYIEQELGLYYSVVKTDIAEILFEARKEENPCSLCSKMRRGALVNEAKKLGCNKLALGHHADDLAETLLLSMIYEGRLSVFSPVAHLSESGVTVIRPLILTKEKDIIPAARSLPTIKSLCPADNATRRSYVKSLLKNICRDVPIAKDRIIGAVTHPERNNLWQDEGREN